MRLPRASRTRVPSILNACTVCTREKASCVPASVPVSRAARMTWRRQRHVSTSVTCQTRSPNGPRDSEML